MRISDWSSDVCSSDLGACRNGSTANSPGAVSGIAMSAMQPMATRQQSVMRSQGFLSDGRSVAMPSSISEQWMASLVCGGADAACAALCTKRDRKSDVQGQSVAVRVAPGGRRILKNKTIDSHNKALTDLERTRKGLCDESNR